MEKYFLWFIVVCNAGIIIVSIVQIKSLREHIKWLNQRAKEKREIADKLWEEYEEKYGKH